MWEDEEGPAEFRRSELARTIPEAYRVEGQPQRETVEVVYVLRDEARLSRRDCVWGHPDGVADDISFPACHDGEWRVPI